MSHPMDREYLREMARLLEAKLPDKYGFIVFAFPLESTGRIFYMSNGRREDCIAAMKEWLLKQSPENWLKHVE